VVIEIFRVNRFDFIFAANNVEWHMHKGKYVFSVFRLPRSWWYQLSRKERWRW